MNTNLWVTFWLPLYQTNPEKLLQLMSEFNTALCTFQNQQAQIAHDDKHERGSFASWPQLRDKTEDELAKAGFSITQHPSNTQENPTMVTILKHKNGYFEVYESPMTKEAEFLKPREMGGHITYFKRYTYMAVLGLATDEDKNNDLDAVAKKSTNAVPRCPKCESPMRLIKGETGDFWGCSQHKTSGCKGVLPKN
jgi:hypothetical protein